MLEARTISDSSGDGEAAGEELQAAGRQEEARSPQEQTNPSQASPSSPSRSPAQQQQQQQPGSTSAAAATSSEDPPAAQPRPAGASASEPAIGSATGDSAGGSASKPRVAKKPHHRNVIDQKLQQEIVALKQAHPVLTSAHIARAVSKLYGVPVKESQVEMIILRSTVDRSVQSDWTRWRRTRYKNPPLEEALVQWVRERKREQERDPMRIIKGVKKQLSVRDMRDYAMTLGPSFGVPDVFKYSNDWIQKVLEENGLNKKGEEISRPGGEGLGNDGGSSGAGLGEGGADGLDRGGSPGSEKPGSEKLKPKRPLVRNEIPFELQLRYEIAVVKRARPHLENKVIAAAIRAKS
ncbi:unnamed protein product [Closterium sp. NIES-53]